MTKEELLKAYFVQENTTHVMSPSDIVPHLLEYADLKKEHFIAISLDSAHKILNKHVISIGILNKTIVHPREVFQPVITDNAESIIIAHNHPSGNIEPSPEDITLTERMVSAGKIIGIEVLDHVIISKAGYYSFLEQNKL